MSGHNPLELRLTAISEAAAQAVLDALRRDFRARTRPTAGYRRHEWGRVMIGETDVSFEMDFPSDPSQPARVCPVILLHSEAYDAASRPGHSGFAGKRALVEFSVVVAKVSGAEGFMLDFAADGPVDPLTIESLVSGLTTESGSGLLHGIAISSSMLDSVKTDRPSAAELNGYLIVDFL